MNVRKDESGQVLVFTVLCATILLGFLALAIDVGLLFRAKRNLQIAADSAATAAALDYYYNSSNGATAITEANAVGVVAASNDNVKVGNGTTVDVHCPVVNGAYASANCNGYFEAIVMQPNATTFMSMFGLPSVTVGARAVAGTPYASASCVDVLNSTGNIGKGGNGNGIGKGVSDVFLFGSFTVSTPHCGWVINGTDPNDALDMQGKGGNLTAGSVSIVGGYTGSDSTPPPVTGVAPIEDPLQSIPQPTKPATACTGSVYTNCYINTGNNANGTTSISNVTINGTLYVTGLGTLSLGGTITSGANGATIYLSQGGMTEGSGTVFTGPTSSITGCSGGCFTAPSSGTYQGIAFMAPISNTSTVEFEFGNSTGAIDGITYLPGATLYLHDSGGGTNGLVLDTDLIVGQIDDQTGSLTINSFSALNPTLTPLKAVALVE